jgi:hypothetical protein
MENDGCCPPDTLLGSPFLVVAQSGSVLAYAPFGGGFSITISHHLVSGVMGLLVLLWAWIFPVWKKPDNLRPINFLLPFALALAAILLSSSEPTTLPSPLLSPL